MIYLDNNASTPLVPEVWDAMRPFLGDRRGNRASSHRFGRQARQGLEDARELIASLLDAYPDEVVFTSGATEANHLALFGVVPPTPGRHRTQPRRTPLRSRAGSPARRPRLHAYGPACHGGRLRRFRG